MKLIKGEVIQWDYSFFRWRALVRITESKHSGYRINDFCSVVQEELHVCD